jgi:anaerobic dimethyl sulfoxide reductase subunit B (iron-sulfur subunit)
MVRQQYGFHFDVSRCVQCHACEIACKTLHNAEWGIKWRRVVGMWQGQFPSVISRTVSMACMHCGNPPCVAVCPRGAIKKRLEDGIVIVDRQKCFGCHLCSIVCPFGAPQYGSDGKMQKCDLCADRVERGEEPACVATCPAEALRFGTLDELSDEVTRKCAQKL